MMNRSALSISSSQVPLTAQVWPTPQPLHTIKPDLLPVIPFPTALLPEPYQPWLVDSAERMQCPLDYMAVGAVIVTASLIGTGCSIRPKRQDSWTVIPNLWGGIVGAPSTLKSPALKEILQPLEFLEAQAWQEYEKAQHDYLVELEAYKASKEAIKKDMLKFASACDAVSLNIAKDKLRDLKEPQEPICKRYSTNDATIEKMHVLLSQNSRGLLLFRDELMGLLTSWDAQGHESDRAFYLEAWNGYGSKTTDCIGRGTIHTKNLCVSLLGSTQPDKLLTYFQRALRGVENDGLLQRFQLLVYPDNVQEWRLIDRKPNTWAREQASRIMTKLTTFDFTSHGAILDSQSGIPYFQFCDPAQGIFYEWLTELEDKLRTSHDEPIMIEHLAKYRKLLPSLALIFHLIDIASGKATGPITVRSLERATAWCDYLASHARRIYALGLSSSHQAARALARKIQEGSLSSPFDIRDVYRKEWAFLKGKEETQSAIDVLITKGWLSEMLCREGKPKKQYRINPKLMRGSCYE